jgi:hypothetical protein
MRIPMVHGHPTIDELFGVEISVHSWLLTRRCSVKLNKSNSFQKTLDFCCFRSTQVPFPQFYGIFFVETETFTYHPSSWWYFLTNPWPLQSERDSWYLPAIIIKWTKKVIQSIFCFFPGKGGFGEVLLVEHMTENRQYALKKMKPKNEREEAMVLQEVCSFHWLT